MPSETRACPSCHTPLPVEAHFCLHCGTPTPTEPGVPERKAPTAAVEVSRVRVALSADYRVERVLGEGGMATVYLAEDLKHKRKVAIKVMRPELAETLGTDRFLREVEIAAQLSHPNILPVFDSGSTNGILWYVMPYIEGETLPARLARDTQLPVAEAVRIAREVTEALAYAHGRGIIHRDIKPANILTNQGHALVADFGIARAIGPAGGAITKTGLAIGTPHYMSPEQASGARDVDGRADVYAVGAVLYEMIAGEPPFTGPTMQVIIARSLTETPRALSATRQGLPPRLNTLVMRALSKSPADRYQSAGALATALTEVEDQIRGTLSGSMPSVSTASAGKAWLVFGFGVLLALTALVLVAVRRGLPVWVLGFAILLIAGGAAALTLTAAAERRRREAVAPGRWDALLTWRNAALGGVAALALWAVAATGFAVGGGGSGSGGAKRVAVMPFQNEGAAGDQYVADGIADEVRGKLTPIPGLEVIASGSTDQYRSSTKSPGDIARELGVDYLLVGKVRWTTGAGGVRQVQVVPELVNGRTGAVTWQQSFDAGATDVLSMQTTIATRVASALGAVLGSHEQQELSARPTSNAAAYDLYLKGRAVRGSAAQDNRRAAGYYEQAVALDSTFVDAWAYLSTALTGVYGGGTRDPAVGQRARQAAERAMQLNPNSVLAHLAMYRYYNAVEIDNAKAYTQIQLALKDSPNDANALASFARVLTSTGEYDSALVVARRARDLDPRSLGTLGVLEGILINTHHGSEAQQVASQLLALDPATPTQVESAVTAYLIDGKLDQARAVVAAALDTIPAPDLVSYFAGYQEFSWVLPEPQRELLFRLTPASFDNDRAWWGQALAISAFDHGDRAVAKAYADSGLKVAEGQLAANPADPQLRVLYGVMLAYLGRKPEAIAAADSVLAEIRPGDYSHYYEMLQTARIFLAVGENDRALDVLDRELRAPFFVTPAFLRIAPLFAPLKGNARFERMIAQTN
ncbi:MAG: protein kinase domain-containing protein [Gemmatimonadales bacterium]